MITIWLTVTKYPYLICNGSFISSITNKTFTGLDCMSNIAGVFSRAPGFIYGFLVLSVLLIYLVFCVVLFFCLSCIPYVASVSGLSILDCLCFSFACLVYPMLPVSLDCPFLIASGFLTKGEHRTRLIPPLLFAEVLVQGREMCGQVYVCYGHRFCL